MRVFVRHLWLCLQYAFRGSFSKANAWPTLGISAILLAGQMTGYWFAFGSSTGALLFQGLAALGAGWVLIVLSKLVIAPSRIYARDQARIRELEAELSKPPLEILFDPSNPSEKFWSLERKARPDEPSERVHYHECRIEVRNASPNKTIRNVRVVKEHTGLMPVRPTTMPFDLTKAELHDLHPLCSVLVPVAHWPHPKIRAGMAAGESAPVIYGPIKVTVSGDDVPPVSRTFKFDWQREPMIYED